ncbi:MAG: radical SAM protein [Kiritimatiellae bacterium]|nr:radical SAM protein [Kiritimatiellia bacterium]
MKYRQPLFRPPAEADSLIFQVAYGCPHNSCRFCGMYKSVNYETRQPDEVINDFRKSAKKHPNTRRIFLADGDAMILPFELLQQYLTELNHLFPRLARINIYANGSSIGRKSEDELKALHSLKLTTLYIGLESGSQNIIDLANKKESVDNMVQGVITAQKCGLRCSVMILLGLGGINSSKEHAQYTAAALNIMQPRLLSALRFIEVPGTDMYSKAETLSEYGAVLELKSIISELQLERTVFRANHTSNPVPLSGRFPQDKERLLTELDYLLSSNTLSKTSIGRRPLSL